MKYLYLILVVSLCACSNMSKEKKAIDIYNSTPAVVYSMTEEEEREKMKDVKGCYDLILGENTIKEVRRILRKHKATFYLDFSNHYKVKGYYKSLDKIKNIKSYVSTIKHPDESMTCIYTSFLNDTLTQIRLKIINVNYTLEKDLVSKYGEGNGEKKDYAFGRDKDGRINRNDVVTGYKYRQWQNDDIVIDWYDDRYLHSISSNALTWDTGFKGSNSVTYTSKRMAIKLTNCIKEYINKENEKNKSIKHIDLI